MNYEAWNRYVLVVIGLLGVLLYVALLYAGFVEFRSRLSKSRKNRRRTRSRVMLRRLRTPKISGD